MTTAPTDTPVVVGPFSLEEFFAWDGRIDGDDGRSDPPMWELVDGMAILMASPGGRHQVVLAELQRLLFSACPPGFLPVQGPLDWVVLPLAPTVRIPDLVIAPRTLGLRLTEPPLLAVEVVSPSARARRRDFVEKRADYAEAGLLHYWVVDPTVPEVVVFAGPGLPEVARGAGDEVLEINAPITVRFAPSSLLP